MEYVKQLSNGLMTWLLQSGLTPQEIQTAVLLIAAAALLLSLIAVRRAGRASGVSVRRLQDKTERTALQFGDLKSSLKAENQKLQEEISFLRQRILTLESRVPAGTSEKPETAEQKKKTAEPELHAAAPASPLFQGLKKTRDAFFSRLSGILSKRERLDEDVFEELEELLITSDLGVQTTRKLLSELKERVNRGEIGDAAGCKEFLKESVRQILTCGERDGTAAQGEIRPEKQGGLPLVILVVGVNGVGKTTSIGKLASRFSAEGARVLLGAADTFRAAASEQIEIWAERAKVEVLRGAENAKPSTVAYEAIHKARKEGFDVVIIDTAGRLHTRVNLMNELGGVISLIQREQPGAPHETLLVVDATTGQNALEQAREFHQRAALTGVIVTKLDGTPKGGIVVAIRDELGLPIRYVGVGESAADLRPFSATDFTSALFAESDEASPAFRSAQPKSEIRAVRRRAGEDNVNPS
jgi:fused signal recognition particle receptor